MCNCLKEIEQELLLSTKDEISNAGKKIHEVVSSGFENKHLDYLSDTKEWKITIPFKMEYVLTKANGEPEHRTKTKTCHFKPNYCPFCGLKM